MSNKLSVVVTTTSHVKSVLHALKYFSENVGGYVYGSIEGGSVTITNVYPVVHSAPVGPVLDLAASFIDALGDSGSIIGYYYANNIRGNKELPHYVEKVASAIIDSQKQGTCLVVCINDDLEWEISRYVVVGTGHKLEEINNVKYDKGSKEDSKKDRKVMIDNYTKDKKHLSAIFDVEDHLDDASVSFTNSWLDEIAKKNI